MGLPPADVYRYTVTVHWPSSAAIRDTDTRSTEMGSKTHHKPEAITSDNIEAITSKRSQAITSKRSQAITSRRSQADKLRRTSQTDNSFQNSLLIEGVDVAVPVSGSAHNLYSSPQCAWYRSESLSITTIIYVIQRLP